MTPNEQEKLCDEGKYLYFHLFHRHPPNNLVDAYIRAHAEIKDLRTVDPRQKETVDIIVDQGLDPIIVEPWLRGKKTRHLLSAKMLLIAYLAECDIHHHPEFSRSARSSKMTLGSIGLATIAAGIRLIRGYIQKMRHELV
jgi:hypothetical protein